MAAPTTTRERVEAYVLACYDHGFEPSPDEVAAGLVDEDVAAGEYEGCSTDLDLAYTEYLARAEAVTR